MILDVARFTISVPIFLLRPSLCGRLG